MRGDETIFVPRRTKIDRRVQRRRDGRQWRKEYAL